MLQGQLDKLALATNQSQRTAIEKGVLLWGSRLHRWTSETYILLDKQLTWLDANEHAPTYEQRFAEWTKLLADYGKACDLLTEAESLKIGVPA